MRLYTSVLLCYAYLLTWFGVACFSILMVGHGWAHVFAHPKEYPFVTFNGAQFEEFTLEHCALFSLFWPAAIFVTLLLGTLPSYLFWSKECLYLYVSLRIWWLLNDQTRIVWIRTDFSRRYVVAEMLGYSEFDQEDKKVIHENGRKVLDFMRELKQVKRFKNEPLEEKRRNEDGTWSKELEVPLKQEA